MSNGMINKNIKNRILVSALVALLSAGVVAQSFDASGLGMANAYGALARGVDAVGWNPANLALPGGGVLEFNLMSLNLFLGNNSLTPDDYDRYFTLEGHEGFWDNSEKRGLLALIPDDGLEGLGNVRANILGLGFGKFALTVQGYANIRVLVPKTPVEIFLTGNQINRLYDFSNIDADGFAAAKFSFAGGFEIPFNKYFDKFTVGVSLNYWMGLVHSEITKSYGRLITTTDETNGMLQLRGRKSTGGSGFGIDLGAAGIINKDWTLSIALQNALGNIRWSSGTEEFLTSVMIDSLGIGNTDSTSLETSDSTWATGGYDTRIPVVFHMAVAYQMMDNLVLTADVEQSYAARLGFTDQASLALGAQYTVAGFLPLRMGMMFGGQLGFGMGMGFGIHAGFFQMDLGYRMQSALWPTYSKSMSTALSIKLVL